MGELAVGPRAIELGACPQTRSPHQMNGALKWPPNTIGPPESFPHQHCAESKTSTMRRETPTRPLFKGNWTGTGLELELEYAKLNQNGGLFLPGDKGGESILVGSMAKLSVGSNSCFRPPMPSRPENMGFMGVCRTSQLLGLPTTLPEADSGGVDG